jgi:signal transduction histidine kinase
MEISDTGVGFDSAQIENAPHVGLYNVMRRLQMFRKAANYRIESAPGQGTKVTIVIPGVIMGEKDENTDCR